MLKRDMCLSSAWVSSGVGLAGVPILGPRLEPSSVVYQRLRVCHPSDHLGVFLLRVGAAAASPLSIARCHFQGCLSAARGKLLEVLHLRCKASDSPLCLDTPLSSTGCIRELHFFHTGPIPTYLALLEG
jgi:hypothetical protein